MISHDEMMGIVATEAAEAAAGSSPRTGCAALVEILEAKLREMPTADQEDEKQFQRGYRAGFTNGEKYGMYQLIQFLKQHNGELSERGPLTDNKTKSDTRASLK